MPATSSSALLFGSRETKKIFDTPQNALVEASSVPENDLLRDTNIWEYHAVAAPSYQVGSLTQKMQSAGWEINQQSKRGRFVAVEYRRRK